MSTKEVLFFLSFWKIVSEVVFFFEVEPKKIPCVLKKKLSVVETFIDSGNCHSQNCFLNVFVGTSRTNAMSLPVEPCET